MSAWTSGSTPSPAKRLWHFEGEKGGGDREDQPDDEGGHAVQHGQIPGLAEGDADERRDEAEEGRGILEEHGEDGRILAAADRIEEAALPLALAELAKLDDPDDALEQDCDGEHQIVDPGSRHRMGRPYPVDPLQD